MTCGAGSRPSSARSPTRSWLRLDAEGRIVPRKTPIRDSIAWTILTMAILLAVVVALAGCGTTAVHHIARATKLPEEVRGFLRVVQEAPVLVGIVGEDEVSERSLAGYIVVHEQDIAQLVRNTEALLSLRAETRR